MDIESFRSYCLQKPGVEEGFPFDNKTLVFKVMGKMFALCALENDPVSVNLKCDPDLAEQLRDTYDQISPGYHMDKKHWNTLVLTHEIPLYLYKEWIDLSYRLVVAKLPKKLQAELISITKNQ